MGFKVGDRIKIKDSATVGKITKVSSTGKVSFQGDTGLTTYSESPTLFDPILPPPPPPPAAPTVSLTASATSIMAGETVTLLWTVTDATTIQASGSWSGVRPDHGVEALTPTANASYTLTATGPGGTATATVSVTVTVVPPPPPPPPPVPATRLALMVTAPITFPGAPLSGGIAFARGSLQTASNVRLDANGSPVLAQFEVLAAWPDQSIKVLLVTVAGQPNTTYELVYGPGIVPPTANPVPAPDLAGTPKATAMDGTTYAFADIVRSIETVGALQTTTRLQGTLGPQLALDVRVSAYKDFPWLIVDTPLIGRLAENNAGKYRSLTPPVGDTNTLPPDVLLKAYDWTVPIDLTNQAVRFGLDGQVVSAAAATNPSLTQTGRMYFNDDNGVITPDTGRWFHHYTFAATGIGTGTRLDGWMDTPQLGVAVRWAWHQYPLTFRASPAGLTISFHPVESAEPFYFLRAGGAKSYRFAVGHGDTQAVSAWLENPPRLMASPAYIASTKVHGLLRATDVGTAGYHKNLIDRKYLPSGFETAWTNGSRLCPKGYRNFGDRMRPDTGWGAYNDTHVGARQYLLEYLMTGDLRWWQFAEASCYHWMDLDVSHVGRNNHPYHANWGPGEPLLLAHNNGDHEARNLHEGHVHLSGLIELYFLTGNKRAYEVLTKELGPWFLQLVANLRKNIPAGGFTDATPHGAEAERDSAWPLYAVNELYRLTSDPKYHAEACAFVNYLLAWHRWQTDHKIKNVVVGRFDWTQGTGSFPMYPKSDNSDSSLGVTNGPSPWMSGPLLSHIIQTFEDDTDAKLLDAPAITSMVLQATNQVVKWGWTGSFWRYFDGATNDGGGTNHLVYPLLWSLKQIQAGVPNPQWYDQAETMKAILRPVRDQWAVNTSTANDATFDYGYATVHPPAAFALMQEVSL